MMDQRFVESTPFSPKAFCYANYVRLFVEGHYVNQMSFVVVSPGAEGPLAVAEDPIHGATFVLDGQEIGQRFRDSFPAAFDGVPHVVAVAPKVVPLGPLSVQAAASGHPVGSSPTVGEGGPWNRKLRMDTVVALARDNAATQLAGADALFGGQPYVFVCGFRTETNIRIGRR